jgi:predicted RNA-binding protein (virulence factor B family)
MAATEKFDHLLANDMLSVKELDQVDLTTYRQTNLGWEMIIDNRHIGLLHHNEVYRPMQVGDRFKGFIKKIYPETNKIDVAAGRPGYKRVEDELEKILRLLAENKGHLPYNDKSDPDAIYNFFAMSKKTFKMAIGILYKQRKISLEEGGIRLVQE